MTPSLTPLTELEAINDMLSLIAETPLASLDEVDSVADAQIARQILTRETRATQETGWSWNTFENYSLSPDDSGLIYLPNNTLDVDPTDQSQDYVWNDGKLWDRTNNTFTFKQPVLVNIKLLFAFDQLPPTARRYISLLAGRKFENRMQGDGQANQIEERDVIRAFADLLNQEAENTDANVIRSSRSVRPVASNRSQGY
jgi:hypothetical protein